VANANDNIQTVKSFFAAIGEGNTDRLRALTHEAIEWIIPGEGWPLAGVHRGLQGLEAFLRKASKEVETEYPEPPEFVAQGDYVMMFGKAIGTIKGTNKTFTDEFVFAITVRNGQVVRIQEYVDTQALARASE
jgi:uncharacterized protein